jgi:hypothetical protein
VSRFALVLAAVQEVATGAVYRTGQEEAAVVSSDPRPRVAAGLWGLVLISRAGATGGGRSSRGGASRVLSVWRSGDGSCCGAGVRVLKILKISEYS